MAGHTERGARDRGGLRTGVAEGRSTLGPGDLGGLWARGLRGNRRVDDTNHSFFMDGGASRLAWVALAYHPGQHETRLAADLPSRHFDRTNCVRFGVLQAGSQHCFTRRLASSGMLQRYDGRQPDNGPPSRYRRTPASSTGPADQFLRGREPSTASEVTSYVGRSGL